MSQKTMKSGSRSRSGGIFFALSALLMVCASGGGTVKAQEHSGGLAGSLDEESAARVFPAKPPYSPYAGRNYPTRPLFGDTHLHTTLSFDAGMVGCLVGPEDAYRFAKGDEVVSSTGQPVRLSRPLDFLVVSDHSDNMGFAPDFIAGAPNILANSFGRRWYNMVKEGQVGDASNEILQAFGAGTFPEELKYKPGTPAFRSTWQRIIKAATDANDPGRFTAIIGYEWTSMVNGNNLHRNILYRDGGGPGRADGTVYHRGSAGKHRPA